jgi:hypothetical protein
LLLLAQEFTAQILNFSCLNKNPAKKQGDCLMIEQENLSKSEKKQDNRALFAWCSNHPDGCDSCSYQGEWQCPASKKQSPEVEVAIQRIKDKLL